MTEGSSHYMIDEDEPMQLEPMYLSSDDDTETQNPMSNQERTHDNDEQNLNQFVIYLKNPTDTVQIAIPNYDVDIPTLSSSATTESEQSRHKHNVSTTVAKNINSTQGTEKLSPDKCR